MSFHSSCTTHPSARGWEPHTPGATDQGAAQAMDMIGVATRLPARAAHSSRPTASDSAPPPTVAVLTGAEELERALQPLLPKQILETRSEEHTSELQSRGHLVCRLLREK